MKCIEWQTAGVYGIYGHLGGGKTLTAVDIALSFLRRGFPVTTNIQMMDLPNSHLYTFCDDIFTVDPWSFPVGAPRGSSNPYRSCIIIDEAAEMFDQYASPSFTKPFLSWLRHSSKRGQFVFLIVQRPEFLQKSLRLLINRWIICDDMAQFRLPVFRIKVPFMAPYVRRIVLDRYGNEISRGADYCLKSEIGKHYNTAQSIATQGRADGSIPDIKVDTMSAFFSTFLLLSVVFVIFIFVVW